MKQLPVAPNEKRQCDGCTACCTVIAVHELQKGLYKRCEHERKGGCSIYEERPESCSIFRCGWLIGTVVDPTGELRPDRSGVIFTMSSTGDKVLAWEVWCGASEVGHAKMLIEYVGSRVPLVIVHPDKRRTEL